jgi:hypothetical protein
MIFKGWRCPKKSASVVGLAVFDEEDLGLSCFEITPDPASIERALVG